jgi:ribosomal protein S18 acetylase RimI-like enzyme
MTGIRPFRPGDEEAIARICLLTADAGQDATGILPEDDLWAAVYALPYVARHPEFAFVAEDDTGTPAAYILAAPDTAAFDSWFRDEWWPRFHERWPLPARDDRSREAAIARSAWRRGTEAAAPELAQLYAAYPAHLHIDLLPLLQGQGLGRRLVETMVARLREAFVPGVQLGVDPRNTGAQAFYVRLGFERLPAPPGVFDYGLSL